MDYSKKDNENQFDYMMRLVGIKLEDKPEDLEWQSIVELCHLNCSHETIRKAMQPQECGGYMIYKYLKEQGIEKVSGQEFLDELTLKQQELSKEKMKVQTEKLGLSQMLREQARFELFIEQAVTAIQKIEPLQVPEPIICDYPKLQSGLLLMSDFHYGTEFIIKGLRGEILNQYSPEIFEQRMWKLLDKTVEICKKEGFDEISIMQLSDEIDGIIRISQLMTLKYGMVDSSIRVARFLAGWLNKLSEYVRIKYYSTEGNHCDARLLTGKKGDMPSENMSKVIQVIIKEMLRYNPNIEVIDNETNKIYVNIQGYNILGIHGEEKSIAQAIRDYEYIYKEDISYVCSGHMHHSNSTNLGFSKGSIGVGSIIGIDEYSMDLKRISDPSATFVVFEKGQGKTIEYNITLN